VSEIKYVQLVDAPLCFLHDPDYFEAIHCVAPTLIPRKRAGAAP